MIPSPSLTAAIRIAAEIHDGQLDKAGEEYLLHPLAVMELAAERTRGMHDQRAVMIVAVLHDAIEDFQGSGMEKSRLRDQLYQQFGSRIYAALDALTKYENEPYDQYIERVAQDWMARIVKVADLTHNMDPRRIPADQIVDKDFERWDKYRKALIRLERED